MKSKKINKAKNTKKQKYIFPEGSIPKQIQNALSETINKEFDMKIATDEIHLERPNESAHGDYASTIALQLSKNLNKKPFEIAKVLHAKILDSNAFSEGMRLITGDSIFISKDGIKIAGPGFINFELSQKSLIKNLIKFSDNDFYQLDFFKDEKIMVEFTDPNPFKEFHIGHAYSNTVGESIARIFEALGAEVKRGNFFGDVGMHVAKSLWGIRKKLDEEDIEFEKLEEYPLDERIKFLGEAYALGATAFKVSKDSREEIKDLNYLVYIVGQEYMKEKFNWEPQVNYKQYVEYDEDDLRWVKKVYFQGKTWSMNYFETIYEILGTEFDYYYPESIAGEYGLPIVKEYLEKGVFTKSDNAVVFEGEKYGLHTRVFINSLGLPTYETKDIGLPITKFKDFKYDKSIIVTANEIDEYYKVVHKALSLIKPELAEKTKHISHGMVKLPEGKMSSRTGKIITGKWLIEETKKRVREIIKDTNRIEKSEMAEVAEILAVGAIKYAFLKPKIGGDIVFDFGESVSFEGNSGPYLQYTYARCKSILNKNDQEIDINESQNFNPHELSIVRSLVHYQETVLEAGRCYSPHLIATFLYELAQRFNNFYQNCPILNEKETLKNKRLLITHAVANVLKHGLNTLGIKTVESM
ncbi:arginine--tRNA ligase [Candidatus Dojkabacteria bacterium]|nr:arginine--tRNA ligase [Candidatus Dojkabacteria bacterium]